MSKVLTAAIHGVESMPICVECQILKGPDALRVFGIRASETDLAELRETLRCALRSSGYEMPHGDVVVGLMPRVERSEVWHTAPLAVAAAILSESGQIPSIDPDTLVCGGLGLSGQVLPFRGDFSTAVLAQNTGRRLAGALDLQSLRGGLEGIVPDLDAMAKGLPGGGDYRDLAGYGALARAAAISVAGHHPLLMVGPAAVLPAAASVAELLPSVMEPLEDERWMETLAAWDAAGLDWDGVVPVRTPDSSITKAGLLGGGLPVAPGETALAHNGVLLLEDIAEYTPATLQSLRPVIDDKSVSIVRTSGSYRMPADFTLMASAKPCPCGCLGDPERHCVCSTPGIQRYQDRLAGPLSDKFEMVVNIGWDSTLENTLSSAEIRGMLNTASVMRAARASDPYDADLSKFEKEAPLILKYAHELGLSSSQTNSAARVARTIADLEGSEFVEDSHMAEALSYRNRYASPSQDMSLRHR